jgi:CDP-diglyceride synthetase
MVTRIALGSSLLAILGGLFLLDYFLQARWAISTLIFLLGLAGWCELGRIGGVSSRSRGGGAVLFAVGLLGTAYFLALGWWEARAVKEEPVLLELGIAGALLGAFLSVLFRENYQLGFQPMTLTITGTLLFGFLFSFFFKIYHHQDGALLGAILVFGIKGTDITAYFGGRAFGKTHFLKVSPNKTLEGCLAAIIFSGLWFGATLAFWPERVFPWPKAILLGIILSITSQVGDLSESLIKRFYRVKDSSSLLPEFGGVLDLIDSALFSGFLFWLVL